jgi:hypothetical protein
LPLFDPKRISALAQVRAVLCGGGWVNRPNEALFAVEHALSLTGGPWRVLAIRVPQDPTDEPCTELDDLRVTLRGRSTLEYEIAHEENGWPSYKELMLGLDWASVVVIPGGNFAETLARAESDASLIRAKMLSGTAVFVGSSTGAVMHFDTCYSADRIWDHGGGTYDEYRPIPAFGAIPGFVSAHYNERATATGLFRGTAFQRYLTNQPVGSIGFGIDTQAGVVFDNGYLSAISHDRYCGVQRLAVGSQINPLRGDYLYPTSIRQGGTPIPIDELYATT